MIQFHLLPPEPSPETPTRDQATDHSWDSPESAAFSVHTVSAGDISATLTLIRHPGKQIKLPVQAFTNGADPAGPYLLTTVITTTDNAQHRSIPSHTQLFSPKYQQHQG